MSEWKQFLNKQLQDPEIRAEWDNFKFEFDIVEASIDARATGETVIVSPTVSVVKENNHYLAKCLENNLISQGNTRAEAIANLQEELDLYFVDVYELSNVEKPFKLTILEPITLSAS